MLEHLKTISSVVWKMVNRCVVYVLIRLLKFYQYVISPWVGMNCRFYPTCSNYAIEAIKKFGCLKGTWLTIKRLVRCQPFCEGGHDPVPDK